MMFLLQYGELLHIAWLTPVQKSSHILSWTIWSPVTSWNLTKETLQMLLYEKYAEGGIIIILRDVEL